MVRCSILKSFKTKIIVWVIVILSLMTLISGTITYKYYQRILVRNSLKDDVNLLNLGVRNIENFISNIHKMAYDIIINEDIQQLMLLQNEGLVASEAVYRNVITANDAIDYMLFVQRLIDYIESISVISNTNKAYCVPKVILSSTKYYEEEMDSYYYRLFIDMNDEYFLTPPYEYEYSSGGRVIGFFWRIRNINRPSDVIGTLLINIELSDLEAMVSSACGTLRRYLWLDGSEIRYSHGFITSDDMKETDVMQIISENMMAEGETSQIIETRLGYLLQFCVSGTDWSLVAFSSETDLLEKSKFILLYSLFLIVLVLPLSVVLILPVLRQIFKPLSALTRAMKEIGKGNLDTQIEISSNDEIQALAETFNMMTKSLNSHIEQSIENERIKRDLEYDLLLSQINPHFIYNILNSIVYMSRKGRNDDVICMTQSLTRMLQTILDISKSNLMTTVGEEIEFLEQYVTIQQYRYKDLFTVVYEIDPGSLDCIIPRSLLQPFVENAIFHGIYRKGGKGRILVRVHGENNSLALVIEDDGVGMRKEKVLELMYSETIRQDGSELGSIGVINVRNRLQYLYGQSAALDIESRAGEGTVVTVKLPVSSYKEDERVSSRGSLPRKKS